MILLELRRKCAADFMKNYWLSNIASRNYACEIGVAMQLVPVQAARVPASVWSTATNILKIFGIMTISKLLVLICSRLDRAE